jgi:hypothetical protein
MKRQLELCKAAEREVECDLSIPARDEQSRSLGRAYSISLQQVHFIRRGGHATSENMFPSTNQKSKQGEWDPEVHADILERLPTFFLWNIS